MGLMGLMHYLLVLRVDYNLSNIGKNWFLIFGLVRTAFCQDIKLLNFCLVRTAFLNIFDFSNKKFNYDKICPDCFNAQQMCEKVFFVQSGLLRILSKQFKSQEMCDYTATKNPFTSEFVPNSLKTQKVWKNLFLSILLCENLTPIGIKV